MNKSEQIGNLAAALSKLQGEIQNLQKDKQGYGYKYVELSSVLDEARPLLAKYELSVSQLCVNDPSNPSVVGVEGVLMHSSNEWISNALFMPVEQKKGLSLAQCSGVIIAYIRRYQLAAMLGIAQTDNDASSKDEPGVVLPVGVAGQVLNLAANRWEYPGYSELVEFIKKNAITLAQLDPWLNKFNVKKLSELKEIEIKEIINTIEVN